MKPGLPVSVPRTEGTDRFEERPQLYVSGMRSYGSGALMMSSTEFPSPYGMGRISRDQIMEMIPVFDEAVRKTRTRLWVIDAYFFAPETKADHRDVAERYYELVADALSVVVNSTHSVDIRILTSQDKHLNEFWDFVKHRRGGTGSAEYMRLKGRVKVSTELGRGAPPIHDRFAILDDTLWHFGAKVGGLHPALSANSGAWNADVHGAIGFFEDLWDLVG